MRHLRPRRLPGRGRARRPPHRADRRPPQPPQGWSPDHDHFAASASRTSRAGRSRAADPGGPEGVVRRLARIRGPRRGPALATAPFDEFAALRPVPRHGLDQCTATSSISPTPRACCLRGRQKAAQFIQLANQVDTPLLYREPEAIGSSVRARARMVKHGSHQINAVAKTPVPISTCRWRVLRGRQLRHGRPAPYRPRVPVRLAQRQDGRDRSRAARRGRCPSSPGSRPATGARVRRGGPDAATPGHRGADHEGGAGRGARRPCRGRRLLSTPATEDCMGGPVRRPHRRVRGCEDPGVFRM